MVKSNGLFAIIDSHKHVNSNVGGMIVMTNDPRGVIIAIACQENATSLRTGNPQQGKIYIMISFIVTNNKLKGDASLI